MTSSNAPQATMTISEFAKKVGMSTSGVRKMEREGRFTGSMKTPSGHRRYTEADVRRFLNIPRMADRKVAVYCRVSSRKQMGELAHQRRALETFCLHRGIAVDEWIEEVGGGLDMHRPLFVDLIWRMTQGEISTLVVAHKDRLCRFGFGLVEEMAQLVGCELVVANAESLSPEEEVVEDVLAVLQHYAARIAGLRSYAKMAKRELGAEPGEGLPE